MTAREPIRVEPGQVWADKNQWHAGRTVRIVEIDVNRATVEVVTEAEGALAPSRCTIGRRSQVLYDHRGLRGYRLVPDAASDRADQPEEALRG